MSRGNSRPSCLPKRCTLLPAPQHRYTPACRTTGHGFDCFARKGEGSNSGCQSPGLSVRHARIISTSIRHIGTMQRHRLGGGSVFTSSTPSSACLGAMLPPDATKALNSCRSACPTTGSARRTACCLWRSAAITTWQQATNMAALPDPWVSATA